MVKKLLPKNTIMINKAYHSFTKDGKELIVQRLSDKLYCSNSLIRNILETMNPPISIQDGRIIMAIATLERIKKELIKLG